MHKCRKAFVGLNIKINTSHQCSCLAFSCYSKAKSSHCSIQFGTSGFQRHSAMKGAGDACSGFPLTVADPMTIV